MGMKIGFFFSEHASTGVCSRAKLDLSKSYVDGIYSEVNICMLSVTQIESTRKQTYFLDKNTVTIQLKQKVLLLRVQYEGFKPRCRLCIRRNICFVYAKARWGKG